MSEHREESERYERIGIDLVESEPLLAHIKHSDVRIAFLASDAAKKSHGRTVHGQCEKVPNRFKWAVPYDFTITVFEPNVERFDARRLRTLIFHELLHVGIGHDRDGNEKYSTVPHDLEDFRDIVEAFGMDWAAPARAEAEA